MHLPARGDPGDPIGGIGNLSQDALDTKDDSFPPDPRALLRPSKPRNNLGIFFSLVMSRGDGSLRESVYD
jgi:hypothetical protein